MRIATLLIFLLVLSCKKQVNYNQFDLDYIFSATYEHSLISSGNNFPDFDSKKDSMDLLLVALHNGIEIKDIQKKLAWTDKSLNNNLKLLKSKNWLNSEGSLKPSVFIATDLEGIKLLKTAKPISSEIAITIENELPWVKEAYSRTELSKKHSFDTMSFLILSNVLLDNWQIRRVEKIFLNKNNRPERHANYYYYSIIENRKYPEEKFGIFGNQFGVFNDSISYSVYGNNRIRLLEKIRKDKAYQAAIINTAPFVSQNDHEIFKQMAKAYAPKLIEILESNRAYMKEIYHDLGYSSEITFEEFFIWWYHFIYTDTTNILEKKGLLNIPSDGNFFYLRE